jgi:light-regulated signal transduction histidine kinase (bacteriophytochrome)
MKNSGEVFLQGNYRHKKKNGEIIFVEVQGSVIYLNGRKAEIVIAKDITEKTNYINALENQNKKLRQVAGMQSHVLREPVSRMIGLIDSFKNYDLPDENKVELIKNLLSSAMELDDVIKNIPVN